MSDIMKYIRDPEEYQDDPDGHLEPWNETIASTLAKQNGITLTDQHWQVIHFLRQHYRENGIPADSRSLSRTLDEQFSSTGGNKALYRLFPKGPISQACPIAGLPLPSSSQDPSFGTSH